MKHQAGSSLIDELAKLNYGQGMDSSRLIGMIVALAGEVFVLKAQNECLRQALLEQGSITRAALDQQAGSNAMQAWFQAEEAGFAQALLEPLVQGDRSINVVAQMRQV